jgi:hypothetical protein
LVPSSLLIDQTGLECDVGLASQEDHAQAGHDRAQMLLRQRGTDRTRRRAGDESRLVGPHALAVGARAPIDRIFQHGRNRAVVLRRDDQHAVRTGDLVLVAHDLGREISLEVLVEHGQVVDANEFGAEPAAAEPHKRLGEPAIDRLAPVGTDDHGDFRQRN